MQWQDFRMFVQSGIYANGGFHNLPQHHADDVVSMGILLVNIDIPPNYPFWLSGNLVYVVTKIHPLDFLLEIKRLGREVNSWSQQVLSSVSRCYRIQSVASQRATFHLQ